MKSNLGHCSLFPNIALVYTQLTRPTSDVLRPSIDQIKSIVGHYTLLSFDDKSNKNKENSLISI